jgi:hypothetical protein
MKQSVSRIVYVLWQNDWRKINWKETERKPLRSSRICVRGRRRQKRQSGKPTTQLSFEPCTFRTPVQTVTTAPARRVYAVFTKFPATLFLTSAFVLRFLFLSCLAGYTDILTISTYGFKTQLICLLLSQSIQNDTKQVYSKPSAMYLFPSSFLILHINVMRERVLQALEPLTL